MNSRYFITLIFLSYGFVEANGQANKFDKFSAEYEQFRHGFYSELESLERSMSVNSPVTKKVEAYLVDNHDRILDYRTYVLNKYVRAEVEEEGLYTAIDEEEFDRIVQSNILINLSDINEKPPLFSNSLIKLLSVNPLEIIQSVASVSESLILRDVLNLSGAELTEYYMKSSICGKYITATHLNGDDWQVKVNAYHYILLFNFNVGTGETSLKEIKTRM